MLFFCLELTGFDLDAKQGRALKNMDGLGTGSIAQVFKTCAGIKLFYIR